MAGEIVRNAGLKERVRPREIAADRDLAEKLHKGIQATKIMAPPVNCLSPIGDALMRHGLVSFLSVIETEGPDGDDGQLDLDQAAKSKGRGKGKAKAAPAPEPTTPSPRRGSRRSRGTTTSSPP